MNKETLEEAAEKYARKQCDDMYDNEGLTGASWGWETALDFTEGAKWQAEKMYSEEDMINFAFDTYHYISELMGVSFNKISENKLHAMYNFEQFKKQK